MTADDARTAAESISGSRSDASGSLADSSCDGLRIGSLCSGYGGLDLGLMAVVGGSVAWHVEYDKHPSAVLDARWPGVPNYGDITATDWSQVEPVDWLTAGYPCQPFSHAGKRKGSADERHLWPAVARAIGVLRPGRVLLENVRGHVSLGLDAVLGDLARLGYDALWGVVPASAAGAPHERKRLFIAAADAATGGWGRPESEQRRLGSPRLLAPAAPDTVDRSGEPQRSWSEPRRRGTAAAVTDDVGRERPRAPRSGWERPTDGGQSAPDADQQGRQGTEPAGRLDLPARGTPADAEGRGRRARTGSGEATAGHGEPGAGDGPSVRWGAYEPAIRRWEHLTGTPAPRPTEPGRSGERLNPRFVEWMQGLSGGFVTDILTRGPALKCLGNGVVPQQGALALRLLLPLAQEVVAA